MKRYPVILIVCTIIIIGSYSNDARWEIRTYLLLIAPYLYLLLLALMAATKRTTAALLTLSSVCAFISIFSLYSAFSNPDPQSGFLVLMGEIINFFLVIVITVPMLFSRGNFIFWKGNNHTKQVHIAQFFGLTCRIRSIYLEEYRNHIFLVSLQVENPQRCRLRSQE